MKIIKELWAEQSAATKIAIVNIHLVILAVTALLIMR